MQQNKKSKKNRATHKGEKVFQTVKRAENIAHPKEEIYFYFQISFVLLKHELIKPKTQTAKERKRKKHASEAREGQWKKKREQERKKKNLEKKRVS